MGTLSGTALALTFRYEAQLPFSRIKPLHPAPLSLMHPSLSPYSAPPSAPITALITALIIALTTAL